MRRALVCLCAWWLCAAARGEGGEGGAVRRALAAGGTFSVRSALELGAAPRVAYRVHADVAVAPLPASAGDHDLTLHFTLLRAQLHVLRGAEWEARASAWDAHAGAAWHARLRAGAVRGLLLPRAGPAELRRYQRALTSLFHFQGGAAGERRNESDWSGECSVAYEALPGGDARRVKLACAPDAAAGAAARRAARYTLGDAAELQALRAEEVLTLHDTLKVRSWVELTRTGAAPRALPPPPGLEPAPPHDDAGEDDAPPDLEEALEAHRAALEGEDAGAGGGAAQARALAHLLPALRAARAPALLRALRDPARRARLPALCRALGLAGTPAAVRAAEDFLRPAADDPLEPLAHAFLAGLALAPRAHDDAARSVLRIAADARRPALADAALLAAAAAARGPAARAAALDALRRELARCRDAACRAVRLQALGNARADVAELLLASAERDEPRAAAAALTALRTAPRLEPAQLARLERLAGNASRALEVRAAALEEAAARLARAPLRLMRVARALHAERGRAAHELRRVLWGRLEALGAPLGQAPRALRTWEARAHGGSSCVLARDAGWRAGGWAARLDSVQLAARGVLRRGTVALHALSPAGDAHAALEVSVWTRGLHALAAGTGGDDDPDEGEEEGGVAGGLAVAVGGVRFREITLFDGQAELLGHVWSGAGGAPTAVARALWPLADAEARVPLLAGVQLRVRARAGAALALDAHAGASLWHRTARAALQLRAALAADVSARAAAPWATLSAEARLSAEPRLDIRADLDFSERAALCVRARSEPRPVLEELRLEAELGAGRLRVRRGRAVRRAAPARTLALGRDNDAACRALRAADDHDDDHDDD